MRNFILALTMVFTLSACSGGLLGIASAVNTVIVADSDRRSIGTIADDNILALNLRAWALNNEALTDSHVNFHVYNSTVLITGEVVDQDVQQFLTNNVPLQSENIGRVIDETIIGPPSSIATRAKDTLIDNRIILALNSQEVVNPVHIKVHTENLVIFLLGDVTEREANKAAEIAASVGSTHGVTKIVKHFNYLKDIPLREQQRAKEREEQAIKEREKLKKQQAIEAQKKLLQEQLKALQTQENNL